MAQKKKVKSEEAGQTTLAATVPPFEGITDAAMKKLVTEIRKLTPDKTYKAVNLLSKIAGSPQRQNQLVWHLATHRAVPLAMLRSELVPAFQLPAAGADEILDLLPRARAEMASEIKQFPFLGGLWTENEDQLLVVAYLQDKERVRARASELPSPLILPFLEARFGGSVSAEEGRAILALLGEATGQRATFLQLPWQSESPHYRWYVANTDEGPAYYQLLGGLFGDMEPFDRGVLKGVRKATFRVSAEVYLGATARATPKELQILWPELPHHHISQLSQLLLARGEPAAFFLAASEAAYARVISKDIDPWLYRSNGDNEAFADADFYRALALLTAAGEIPAATDALWGLTRLGDTQPERQRLLARAFGQLPRERALAIAERFLVAENFYFESVAVILAAHFEEGMYERILTRVAANPSASKILGLPGAPARPQLAAAHERATSPLKDYLKGALDLAHSIDG